MPSRGRAAGRTVCQIRRALRGVRERKVDHRAETAQEGVVHGGAQVGGDNGDTAIALKPLQQIRGLGIGVAVVAVLDLGAAAGEQRLALVKQQDGAGYLGGVEDAADILLRLADIFRDQRRKIDAVKRQRAVARAQIAGKDSAAMVLPVPEGPLNNAVSASPRADWARNPQSSSTFGPNRRQAASWRSCAS